MSIIKLIAILLLNFHIVFVNSLEKALNNQNANLLLNTNEKYEEPTTYNQYDTYTINDLIFRPIFILKLHRTNRLKRPDEEQKFEDLDNNALYIEAEEENSINYRLKRSSNSDQPFMINNEVQNNKFIEVPKHEATQDEDLSLAETSIPFHPLFAIRRRAEVKRRYRLLRRRT